MASYVEIDIHLISKRVGALLMERGLIVGTAESCTGGAIASLITDMPGSSNVFNVGFVTYANSAKNEILDVDDSLLNECGAVSEPVVKAIHSSDKFKPSATPTETGVKDPWGPFEKKLLDIDS